MAKIDISGLERKASLPRRSEARARDEKPEGEPPKSGGIGRWVALAAMAALFGYFYWRSRTPPPSPPKATPVATATTTAAPERPRCVLAKWAERIGDAEAPAEEPDADIEDVQIYAPFSVELGRAIALRDGSFAVGVKREHEGATHAEVVVAGETLETFALDRLRGDLDAPTLALGPESWVAALLEPDAGGYALKLAKPTDDGLFWGAEIAQGRDESLAFDVAFGGEVGVVTWDDVTEDGERAVVVLATVTPDALEGGERARTVSREEIDAELPRVVTHEGGFWLAYVARAPEHDDSAATDGDPEGPDSRFAAERIQASWIELLPLDRQGEPTGTPRAVTPRDGHVLSYDLAITSAGEAIVAWRDDDAPSGAHGGSVAVMVVEHSGAPQTQPVTDEEVGAGVPTLLPGWLAIHDARGRIRLAPMDGAGVMQGPLQEEELLGLGQLLAGVSNTFLLARPSGRSFDLTRAHCDPTIGVFRE